MALVNANVAMTLVRFVVEDDGYRLFYVAVNPGAGQESEYDIFFTDAEAAAIGSAAQYDAAVALKLNRKFRTSTITTRLNNLIGRVTTI